MLDRLRGRKRWALLDEGIQLNAREIKETFHLLDMNHGGTLHFGDLEFKLEDVGVHVTEQQIQYMMKLIKKKGHMINYFQYLAIINNLANYIEKIAACKISKQKIYDILVRFLKRSALSNLTDLRAGAPQVVHPRLPNVLKHFMVGVSLDGLTQRQLVRRLREMTRSKSPRRPKSGRLHRRRSLSNTRDGYRNQSRGIARTSSDLVCQVKENDRYLTSLISLTSVRGKSEVSLAASGGARKRRRRKDQRGCLRTSFGQCLFFEMVIMEGMKAIAEKTSSAKRKPQKSSAKASRSKKSAECSDGEGTKSHKKLKRSRSSSSKPRKSQSGDPERKKERKPCPQSSRGRKTRKNERDGMELPLKGSTTASLHRLRHSARPIQRSGEATVSRNRSLTSRRSHLASGGLHTPSSRSFLASGRTLSGTIDGIQRELIRRCIQSAQSGGGSSDWSSLNQLPATKLATAQVGGRYGDNRRRKRQSRPVSADDKEQYNFFNHRNYKTRRNLVARLPAYPGLPYITPYYFPKMSYFDIPFIRNEMALRRRICSEVMSRQYEEEWRKRSLLKAFMSISSPLLQKRFERAIQAYGYKLK